MVVTTLDTHEADKELRVTRSQDIDFSSLATKADLQVGLAETKADILKSMVGSIGVQTVVILGAVVALVKTMIR